MNAQIIQALQQTTVDATSVDEAIALSAFARQYRQEYDIAGIPLPAWLEVKSNQLRTHVQSFATANRTGKAGGGA